MSFSRAMNRRRCTTEACDSTATRSLAGESRQHRASKPFRAAASKPRRNNNAVRCTLARVAPLSFTILVEYEPNGRADWQAHPHERRRSLDALGREGLTRAVHSEAKTA